MQDFYRCQEGQQLEANDLLMFTCRKLVSDMMYESRVSQNRAYYAKIGRKATKRELRNVRLEKSQYMEVNIDHY